MIKTTKKFYRDLTPNKSQGYSFVKESRGGLLPNIRQIGKKRKKKY